ncbi:MAG TPA: AI-2E family transporter [Steroidobacteraceae bacterium]|jgi:predicted PurR-regulated permease PerM
MKSENESPVSPLQWRQPPFRAATRALIVIATCAVVSLLYAAHEVIVPVALALLFATMLSGAVETLYAHGVPRSISAVLLLCLLLTIIGLIFNVVEQPARDWFSGLPRTMRVIEHKVHPAAQFLNQIEALTSRAGAIGAPAAPAAHSEAPAAAAPAAPAPAETALELLSQTRSGLVSTLTVVILCLFLLSGGPPMLARMAASLSADVEAVQALRVVEAIRAEVGRYYGTIALINLGLGIATGLTMLLLGVPNPFLWGTMAALLNFIPYVGGATTLVVLSVVALVSFDSVGRILAVPAAYLALATLEGQVVQPLLVGRRLALNPVVVFLAIWFGGCLWGIAGIVIAIPALVALKVAIAHRHGSHALLEFLGPANSASEGLRHAARSAIDRRATRQKSRA